MRFTKDEAIALAKSAPELHDAVIPPGLLPWADLERLRPMTGVEMDRAMLCETPSTVEEFDEEVEFRDRHKMQARIVRPSGIDIRNSALPLFVYYHGGGWISGSYLQGTQTFRRLVSALRLVAVGLPYRLAPENKFPIPQHDGYDGLKWAVKRAANWGADPSQSLLVGGASAGGQVAAVCSLHWLKEKQNPPITGIYYYIPWLMTQQQVPEKYRSFFNSTNQEEMKDSPMLKTRDVATLQSFLGADETSDWYSPLMAPELQSEFPPAYFQVSGQDPFRDHSLIYEDILKQAGVRTRLDMYSGLFHGFSSILPTIPQSKQFADDQTEGFGWLLKKQPDSKMS